MEAIAEKCKRIFAEAREASLSVARLGDSAIARLLCAVADAVDAEAESVLAANRDDCSRMSPDNPKYDRLLLTPERLAAITSDMRRVSELPSPLGKIMS